MVKWLIAFGGLGFLSVLLWLLSWSKDGQELTVQALSALNSPTEIAIGFCVAYLGFDRFRFRQRLRNISAEIGRRYISGADLLNAATADQAFNLEEKTMLAVYGLAGDETVGDYIAQNKGCVVKNSYETTVSRAILLALVRAQIDRVIVIALVTVLCCWASLSAFLQFDGVLGPVVRPNERLLFLGVTLIGLGFFVPAVIYLVSSLALEGTRRVLDSAAEGWAATIARNAPTGPPTPAPPAPSPAPPPKRRTPSTTVPKNGAGAQQPPAKEARAPKTNGNRRQTRKGDGGA